VHVDWTSLATVAVVAAGAALSVILLVAFAVVGQSARTRRRVDGSTGAHADTGTAVAVLCTLAAGLIVGYGLFLIIRW
jgi:hypothetical protein